MSSSGSPPGPPSDPPVLQRGRRAAPAPAGPATSAPPPPPGVEVGPEAAVAAGLSWDGDLARSSPLRLAGLVAAAQATGRLLLHGPAASYALLFRRGTPEHASSNSAEDDLGRFLVGRGAVTGPALAAAEMARAESGAELVSVLAAQGGMNPAESFRFLQEHAVLVLSRALALEEGRAFWEPNVPLPASAFPLGSRLGLLGDAVRRLDALTVRRRLGARAHRAATRVGGRVQPTELKLSALEARAAGLFDGVRSVAELAAAHPQEADVLHRVALLLAELDLLAFGAEREAPARAATQTPIATTTAAARDPATASVAPTEGEPRRAATPSGTGTGTGTASQTGTGTATGTATRTATPTPKPPATPAAPAPATQPAKVSIPAAAKPAAAAAPRADAVSLQALADRLKGADHFQVLGVARDAAPSAVKIAYFALAKQVHPDAAAPGEPAEARQLRADVFARVSEAWNVLSDDARKKKYLDELAAGAAVDVAAILQAEELFVKATVLVKTRQYDEAAVALDQAKKLNDEEPEFDVWRAWVGFLRSENRKAAMAPAASSIEAALKRSPRCMPAYLFLGQMAKVVGDLALAERHLRRGLAVDPEHAELERELKYLRK